MDNKYKILEEGKDNKVLVEWERGSNFYYEDGREYSVHTISLQGNLIWGHYFRKEADAREYFKQYKL